MLESIDRNSSLLHKIQNAPPDPGCYLFKDRQNRVIYIGKAVHLKNRVSSYCQHTSTKDPKTQSLLKHIADVDFIVTHSEIEALILENTLIKHHHPKYNILLRDDKTFPYVKITNEPFARIIITRRLLNDGAQYYGPYTDSRALRNTIRLIRKIFTVRTCKYKLERAALEKGSVKLCLQYHIHNCDGPCQKMISRSEYDHMISKVDAFLQGDTVGVIEFLEKRMKRASEALKFEEAARYRDHIQRLHNYTRKQSIELRDFSDRDILCLVSEEDCGAAVLFRIRQGKVIGKETMILENMQPENQSEAMRRTLLQTYANSRLIPPEINVNVYPGERAVLQEWLTAQKGHKVKLTKPAREDKLRLLKMAQKNARIHLQEHLTKKSQNRQYSPKSLITLQQDLQLPRPARIIEAFDISNIRGQYAVGSLIVFENARPRKKSYRRFKIKTVQGINDVKMMAEVVRRRYHRQLKESNPLPDLILIDGGRGQLNAVEQVLLELQLERISIIGLAKRLDEVYIPGRKNSIQLPRDSASLRLLQRIRDEAHRFAISYHRKVRSHLEIKSQLDSIPGIGSQKKKNLIRHFKTVANIRSASVEDITAVEGIGKKLAQNIWAFLH